MGIIKKVAVLMGSESDMNLMQPAVEILNSFEVPCEVHVISAHRTPEKAREFAISARDNGFGIIIAGAGAAAHLPGVLASWSTLPVIGIPLPTSELKGVDSLYSIVQMPAGVPVATMAVGSAGVRNAAYFAVQILANADPQLQKKFEEYRKKINSGKK